MRFFTVFCVLCFAVRCFVFYMHVIAIFFIDECIIRKMWIFCAELRLDLSFSPSFCHNVGFIIVRNLCNLNFTMNKMEHINSSIVLFCTYIEFLRPTNCVASPLSSLSTKRNKNQQTNKWDSKTIIERRKLIFFIPFLSSWVNGKNKCFTVVFISFFLHISRFDEATTICKTKVKNLTDLIQFNWNCKWYFSSWIFFCFLLHLPYFYGSILIASFHFTHWYASLCVWISLLCSLSIRNYNFHCLFLMQIFSILL